jgi:DHA2 family multidrug resistance protein-like MFS transporter
VRQRLFGFSVIAVGTMMAILNGTISNVALPTIARAFRIDAATSIWATNGFQVPVTMLLLPAAALGARAGFARVYRGGVAIFLAGSILCSAAPSFEFLVAGRALQGIGAAGIMSVGPAILREIFPAANLGQALGWNALVVAVSSAAGPTIGGALLAVLPWKAIFAFTIPFGLYAFIAGRAALHDRGDPRKSIDAVSVLTSAAGIGLLVVSLDGFAHEVNRGLVLSGLAGALVLLGVFLRRQSRSDASLLPPAIFRVVPFSLSTATSLASFFAASIAIVALPFLFQSGMGRSALESGLLFAPWPLATAVSAPFAGRLADRLSPPILSTAGLGVLCLGLVLLATLSPAASVADIVWRETVCGLGFGIFQSPNNRMIMTSLPPDLSGNASGMLALARLAGQTFGVACVAIVFGLFGAVLTQQPGARANPGELHAIFAALWIAAGLAAAAAIISAARLRTPASQTRASASG